METTCVDGLALPKASPAEMARRVRLAFRRMPEEAALTLFAKAMTSPVSRTVKIAAWDAVRYSHIWWTADDVLKGAVMENAVVQKAFADAVPMRRWLVEMRVEGYEAVSMTLKPEIAFAQRFVQTELHRLIFLMTHFGDSYAAEQVKAFAESPEDVALLVNYQDKRGNNLLWYLTYRDDQNAKGGFACPCLERELLRIGVDPNHRNEIGLCWNDVRRHVMGASQEG